ncbi:MULTISPECIES: HNH endonuclease [unclassified Agromyces]|uniref:HNH endonuclease n=1 Tax=unclassified Agromyces TaxID=2639701 RepID=UPI00301481BB
MADRQEQSKKAAKERGEITAVEGRGTTENRNLAALHSVTFATGNVERTFQMPRPKDAVEVSVQKLHVVRFVELPECPICLAPKPTSAEHVPPESMGGGVITRSCERCNNEFGSRIEPHLLDWYEHAVRASFRGDAVPGKRVGPRMLVREASDGRVGLIFDRGKYDEAITEIFDGGEFEMIYSPPDPGRVQVGLLKSAYLAACAVLGEVLRTERAEAVREELQTALSAPRNQPLKTGPIARQLRAHRTYRPARRGEVSLVVEQADDGFKFFVSLAEVLVVDWPLDPIQMMSVPRSALGSISAP